jgi:hypothetical protein
LVYFENYRDRHKNGTKGHKNDTKGRKMARKDPKLTTTVRHLCVFVIGMCPKQFRFSSTLQKLLCLLLLLCCCCNRCWCFCCCCVAPFALKLEVTLADTLFALAACGHDTAQLIPRLLGHADVAVSVDRSPWCRCRIRSRARTPGIFDKFLELFEERQQCRKI